MHPDNRLLITSTDAKRLEKLLESLPDRDHPEKAELENELARATIVDIKDVPETVVTMNSVVRFQVEPSGREFCLRLTYPEAAGSTGGSVSVLAPVGSALLGLSVGDTICWPKPGGGQLTVTIIDVEYQPERSGDYHM